MEDIEYFIYDVVLSDDSEGVYAIGIVENPAIKRYFMAHSEEEIINIEFKLSDDKYKLTGPILVENQLIKRNIDGNLAYVRYSMETIEKISQKFIQNPKYHKFNLNHTDEKIDVDLVGVWVDYNTRMLNITVKNSEPFTDEFLNKFKGFSLEGIFDLQKSDVLKIHREIKQDENKNKIEEMKITQMISNLIKMNIKQALDIYELIDGLLIVIDSETMVANYLKEDGTTGVILAAGEYQTTDGKTIIVGEEGKITEIIEKEMVETPTAPVEGDDSETPEPVTQKVEQSEIKIFDTLLEKIQKIEEKLTSLETTKKVMIQSEIKKEEKEELNVKVDPHFEAVYNLANKLKNKNK